MTSRNWVRGVVSPLFLIGVLVPATGCGGGTTTSPAATAPSTDTAANEMEIELNQVSASGFDAALEEQKGKAVLVDFWFLGCLPCKQKFHHIVELHEKYKDDGLVVMSYSIMPEDWQSKDKVLDFLKEKDARFANYVAKTQDDAETVQEKYKVEFTPDQLLLDRSGNVIEVPEETSPEDLELLVRKALAK